MKAVAKLKDEARKNEQAEEWEQAIAAYDEVLRVTDNAESELPLYNRIGDLYVRMGRPADAVNYYERAADHYAEAGLYNNAIALCNKALRYVPNRLELLRKLGQFSAAQGFLIDARRWYLEYAERQVKNGEIDDAFAALEDFATVYEDAEIRELLGRQFKAHNRIGPAVIALKRAHALRLQAGEQAAAEALKAEILKMVPDAFSVDDDSLSAPAAAAARPRKRTELPGFSDPPPAPAHTPAMAASPPSGFVPEVAAPAETEPYEEAEPEPEPAAQAMGFDEKLAELELDRALGYESTPAPVETPVFDAAPAAQVDDTPQYQQFDTEPQFEESPAQSVVEPVDEYADEPVVDDVDDNVFTLDLPPLDLPPLDLPLVPESEPLPFLTFDNPPASGARSSNDDLLPLLEFDPGPRSSGSLGDLPQFETPEPMEPIDLDAAFASMKPPGTTEPKAPTTDVWKQPPAWLQPASVEPATPVDSDIQPFISGAEAPWTEPLEFGYAPPPGALERPDIFAPASPAAPPEPAAEAAAPPVEPEWEPAEEIVEEVIFEPPAPAAPIAEAEPLGQSEVIAPPEPPAFEAVVVPEAESLETLEVEETEPPQWEMAGAGTVPEVVAEEPYETEPDHPEMAEPPAPEPAPAAIETGPSVTAAPARVLEEAVPAAASAAPELAVQARGPAAEFALVQQQIHAGDTTSALRRLEELHGRLAAEGQYREAWHACELLLQLDSANLRALQQRVEYATALGQRDLLLRSYLELGRHWLETGANKKGAIIYQRVLEIDPFNEEAQSVVHGAAVPDTKQGYVDLFALISDEAEEASTRFVVAEKAPTGDEERDFSDMLAQFRQKVSENLSLSDTNAHYDLGLAFKEMGLIDEAIAEFQTAIKGGGERLKFYEELGQCFLLKQQYNVAVNVLNRALQIPIDEEGHLVGVYYTLGRSYEELGRPVQAREAYERVIGLDINFQDASQRLASL